MIALWVRASGRLGVCGSCKRPQVREELWGCHGKRGRCVEEGGGHVVVTELFRPWWRGTTRDARWREMREV